MNAKTLAASTALALALGAAGLAHATSVTWTFDLSDPAAGLGAGPYGSVTITEDTVHSGWLDFVVTPATNYEFHKTQNSGHEAFYFDLKTDPGITIMNLPAGFSVGPTLVSSPPFGIPWDYSITVAANNAGPLTFQVKRTDSVSLTVADLGDQLYQSTHHVKAAADFIYTDPVTGKTATGNVGAEARGTGVPEPATWAMMIVGFGLAGIGLRNRRRVIA